MIAFKKLWLLLLFSILIFGSYAQNINWILGTWKGAGNARKSQSVRALNISSVNEYNFTGTRSIEVNDRNHTKIVTEISGRISKDTFYIKDGAIIFKKDPPHTTWVNCTQCTHFNKVLLNGDSILLTINVFNCAPSCDGIFSYFKLLPDFDTTTQRSLVNMFGTPEQILAFKPSVKIIPPVALSDPDNIKPKQNEDSIKKANEIAKKVKQQHVNDSTKNAVAIQIKRQQQIDDSTKNAKIVAKKRQQEINDSIAVVKKKQQQQTEDSLNNIAAIARKRQQQIDDSTKNAVAIQKKRQQQINDSTNNAAIVAKKKQQQVEDSLAVVKTKQQQQTEDSLNNIAAIAKKRQQQIEDSTNNANNLSKQRQQKIQDSIAVAKKLKQKEIDDSTKKAVALKRKRQQQFDDSTKNAAILAKKKQQINDSLAIVKKKQQQQTEDSLNNVTATAKKRQQQVDDSLKNIAANSIKKPPVKDSAKAVATVDKSKMLEQRQNVLLQTYRIKTPDILIELFDNAQIDGDRVSVFHNNTLIVNNQTLLREPITFKIHADAANPQHEFILVAENLGTIPPNTALMRITADNQVYKLSVKTDLKTNAKIIFYYDGN